MSEHGIPEPMYFAGPTRWYAACLETNLFGEWEVLLSWGSRFTRRGGGKAKPVPTAEEGRALMMAIARRRIQHGYRSESENRPAL